MTARAPEPPAVTPEHEHTSLRLAAALGEVARSVSATLDLNIILERVFDQLGQFVPFDSAAITLLREGELVVAAGRGFPPEERVQDVRLQMLPGAPHYPVVAEGHTLVVPDVQATPGWQKVPGGHLVHSWIGTPLVVEGRTIGMLTIDSWTPGIYTEHHAALARAFASHVAMAIRNAQLYEESQRAYAELHRTQTELLHHERLRALGELASGVAHDFNNVLAGILGNAQLLLLETTDPAMRAGLQLIERAAQDAAVTIRRLQDFARANAQEPLVPVDLAAVAESALALTRPRWRAQPAPSEREIRVETSLAPAHTVPAEAAELRQVLINLILNGIDAMPSGGTLRIETGVHEGEAFARVRDTGVGIAPDLQPRIFEPFVTTKGARGSGMGLAMSRALVARQGGRITVESAPGAGSCFTIWLPHGDVALPHEPQPALPAWGARGRVLVVDDDGEVRALIQRALQARGYEVTVSDRAMEALALLRRSTFDLLVTDLGMPEMSGWDLVRRVRAEDQELGIILLSGWGQAAVEQISREELVDWTLDKPFALEALQRSAAETMRLVRERRERDCSHG
ncbi:MAG TPA: ATP-binding protein [Roseiflexaceae bacterium]|nr:ATP-binding protein [Roseiflexaceae bacterium]